MAAETCEAAAFCIVKRTRNSSVHMIIIPGIFLRWLMIDVRLMAGDLTTEMLQKKGSFNLKEKSFFFSFAGGSWNPGSLIASDVE